MRTTESRNCKINLQIKKRRDINDSPSSSKIKQVLPNTKSTNHSKKLNVTVHNRHDQKTNRSLIPHDEPKKIVISEFRVCDIQANLNQFTKSRTLSKAHPLAGEFKQNVAFINSQPLPKQYKQQRQLSQSLDKREIISQIMKKEAQISFYQHLLEQKNSQTIEKLWIRQKQYEEYIQNLISIYQAQMEKNKRLSKEIQEKQFEKRRQIINHEGKMGLNFSPKQLSTFSGMSGSSILLDSTPKHPSPSGIMKKKRSELFSFGSNNKIQKSRSMSKWIKLLDTDMPFIYKGKRITFD